LTHAELRAQASQAWEIGGEIGRLSRVVHPWSSRERLIAVLEIIAYSDESERAHKVSGVAGYWGLARHWETLGGLWNAKLKEYGLGEFHAEDCEQNHGEFKDRNDRREIRDAFIEIITHSTIHGYFHALDLRFWDPLATEIERLRFPMGDPYYIAFQMALEGVSVDADRFGPDERVAFVFDDRHDSGKALGLFRDLKYGRNPAFAQMAQRLGTVAFVGSNEFPGLQAADLLAYEAHKYLAETAWAPKPRPPRPEWAKLTRRFQVAGHGINSADAMNELVERMRVQWGGEAKARDEARAVIKANRAVRAEAYRARRSPSAPRSPEPGPPEEPS
jgi:hypothetical protein